MTEELVNESIKFEKVLVIGSDGEKLGVKNIKDALNLAYDQDLDLYCIAPNGTPPVCKIMNYGKFRFENKKKSKEAKRNQHVTEVKPIRLSPVIDTGDFETKVRQCSKWLNDGMKVKADMRFRGRLITRLEVGKKVMSNFIESLQEFGTVEKQPALEGNTMSVVISPKKKAGGK